MNNRIKKYIRSVIEEIENTSIADYNLDIFHDFSDFDRINFHILNKHIIENGNTDLFIGIPEEDYRENFFESIFYAVCAVKLFQNYCAYQQISPKLEANDIIFTTDTIYRYKGSNERIMFLEKRFPAKNEKNCIVEKPRAIYTKLDPTFDFQKRKTVEYLKGYNKFLQTTFNDQHFPLLTSFVHKTLIISDKQLIKVDENIPFRYHTRNGIGKHNIPVDTFIEVCNSFTVAKNLIEEGKIGDDFDEVIIIGDAKYRQEIFPDIQNGKFNGLFKSIILIGTDQPQSQHEFLEWNWTKREIIIAHNEEPTGPEPVIIEDVALTQHMESFHSLVENMNTSLKIDISHLLKFTNYFLRQVVCSEEALSAYTHYMHRVKNYLEEKDFEALVLPHINYSKQRFYDITSQIFEQFQALEQLFLEKNLKWEAVISLATNQKIYLLVDKQQAEPLRLYLKANDIRNVYLVSNKKVPNVLFLDKFLADENLNNIDKVMVVSYLSDPKIFNQLMEVKGKVAVLCYKGLDDQIFKNLKAGEENALARHLSHTDRNHFVNATFKMQEISIIQSRFFRDIFDFKDPGTTRHFNTYGEPSNDGVWYEIKFSDGTEDVLMASKTVMWLMDGEQTEITIEECSPEYEIKYYKNTNRSEFQELLRMKDSKGVLAGISHQSELWKNALKTLLMQFKSIKRVYKEVMNGANLVSEKHFEKYFEKDCSTQFPNDKILHAIHDCFKRNRYSQNMFMKNFSNILEAASQHKSLSISFGHYLSRLFSGDLTTDIDGVISEADKLPQDLKNKVLAFIKTGTIKSKKILKSDDKRISIQSELDFQGHN